MSELEKILLTYSNKILGSWRSYKESKLYSAKEHADKCNKEYRPEAAQQIIAWFESLPVMQKETVPDDDNRSFLRAKDRNNLRVQIKEALREVIDENSSSN